MVGYSTLVVLFPRLRLMTQIEWGRDPDDPAADESLRELSALLCPEWGLA